MRYSLAVCATDPPLVLSHYPLHHLPAGAMNVHGHLHNQFEPTALAHQPGGGRDRLQPGRPRLGPGQGAAAARRDQTEPRLRGGLAPTLGGPFRGDNRAGLRPDRRRRTLEVEALGKLRGG